MGFSPSLGAFPHYREKQPPRADFFLEPTNASCLDFCLGPFPEKCWTHSGSLRHYKKTTAEVRTMQNTTGQLDLLLSQVNDLLAVRPAGDATDGELLLRFIRCQDEAAFAALLQRHGPMVWGVCRRVLSCEKDAEDAFQATFLVFVRNASQVRKHDSVSCWLHGVAYRIALKARNQAARRRDRERHAEPEPQADPTVEASQREFRAVLDEELSHLPEKYRTPLVLCCLEGKSKIEAARQLGWKAGTVSSRLARGRDLLRDRLTRRGITLAAAPVLLVAGEAAQATVPIGLVATTLNLALLVAAGEGVAPSASVAALAKGVLHVMAWSKLKALAATLFLAVLACAGTGLLALRVPAEQPRGSDAPRTAAAPPLDLHDDPLPPGALFRAGTVRLRHGGPVAAVAFSPEGKVLASAGWDHSVRLWDRATGRELHRLGGHRDAVFSLSFAPDGKTLASAGKDKTLRLWDTTAGKELKQLGQPAQELDCLAFAPDGKSLAAGGRFELVRIWDVATGKVLCTPESQAPPFFFGTGYASGFGDGRFQLPKIGALALAFAPGGKLLAGGNKDGTIRFWDVVTGKELRRLQGHGKGVTSIAFSPDGKTLVSGAAEAVIRLWDVSTGKELRQLKGHSSAVFAVAFAPGGKVVGSGGEDGTVRLWNAATGEELCRRHAGGDHVYGIAFSPDGRALASAQAHHTVGLWSVSAETLAGRKEGPGKESLQPLLPALQQAALVPFAFSPDGRSLAAVSRDGTICLCDPATGKEVRRLGPHRGIIKALVFSPDGTRLASGSWDDPTIRVWDVAGDKPPLALPGHSNAIRSLAFSLDGKTLASVSHDKTLRLWDLGTGKELHQGKHEAYLAVAFSPDGKVLADSRYDGSIYLWDTATGKEVGQVRTGVEGGTFCMAFSPDGRTLAVAGLTTAVRLYEVATGRLRCQFAVRQGSVHALAFTADGRTLATGGGEALTHFRDVEEFKLSAAPRLSDYKVCLWDVATGKQVHALEGHQGGVYALAFSPDSRRLVSRSWDTTALVWGLPAIGEQPARPRDPLTAKELQDLWSDLGNLDAEKAHQTLGRLAGAPDQAVSFLGERVRPVYAVKPSRLAELLDDLDSPAFPVRERATVELKRLGELAEEDVRKALQAQPSLEMRRRLEGILSNLAGPLPSAERLQSLRALEILEKIGSPAARQVLERLADGSPRAWLTREAAASVQRLARRLPAPGR